MERQSLLILGVDDPIIFGGIFPTRFWGNEPGTGNGKGAPEVRGGGGGIFIPGIRPAACNDAKSELASVPWFCCVCTCGGGGGIGGNMAGKETGAG